MSLLGYFFCASLAILCVWSVLRAHSAARIAAQATEFPRAELRSFELRLQSMSECLTQTDEALKVLANRVKMQRVRNAANHISDPSMSLDLPTVDAGTIKDQLRRRAGLIAGQPAPHK